MIIIGAGNAGLCLALFLKKAGIPCVVYEAYPYITDIGSALTIASNGMRVLQELGLAKAAIEKGNKVDTYEFKNHKQKVLGRITLDGEKKYGVPFVFITRANLHKILYEVVEKQGIAVHFQKRLTAYDQTEQGVVAHFEDGSQTEGTLMIGADGVNSSVRNIMLNGNAPPTYTGFYGVGGFVNGHKLNHQIQKIDPSSEDFVFGLHGFFGYGYQSLEEICWWCNIACPENELAENLTTLSHSDLKQKLSDRYQDFHAPAPELIAHTDKIAKVIINETPEISTWSAGRVMLIGDAAHAITPTSGQGVSLAFEDAIILAKLLKQHTIDGFEKVFAGFEALRKPRVSKIRKEANKQNANKKVLTPFQATIRDMMLKIILKLFGIKSLEYQFKFKVDWE